MLAVCVVIGLIWAAVDSCTGGGKAQKESAPQPKQKPAPYAVITSEDVPAGPLYYGDLRGDLSKENHRQAKTDIGEKEPSGYAQITVHFYRDRTNYEQDEKWSTGFVSEDGSWYVTAYSDPDFLVEGSL